MFIDIHAHAYRYRPVFGCGFCTAEELIAEYDKLGISMGVVQPIVSPEVYEPQANEDVLEMAEKYPQYQFEKHKGYVTKLHYEMIEQFGVSEIHRRSFLKNILGEGK